MRSTSSSSRMDDLADGGFDLGSRVDLGDEGFDLGWRVDLGGRDSRRGDDGAYDSDSRRLKAPEFFSFRTASIDTYFCVVGGHVIVIV